MKSKEGCWNPSKEGFQIQAQKDFEIHAKKTFEIHALAKVHQPKDLWIYGQNTQIAKYIVGGTQKPL